MAAATILSERARAAHQLGLAGGEGEFLPFNKIIRAVLPITLHQLGFIIEEIKIRRRTGEMQIDDPLCLGGEMREPSSEWIGRRRWSRKSIPSEQGAQRDGA